MFSISVLMYWPRFKMLISAVICCLITLTTPFEIRFKLDFDNLHFAYPIYGEDTFLVQSWNLQISSQHVALLCAKWWISFSDSMQLLRSLPLANIAFLSLPIRNSLTVFEEKQQRTEDQVVGHALKTALGLEIANPTWNQEYLPCVKSPVSETSPPLIPVAVNCSGRFI